MGEGDAKNPLKSLEEKIAAAKKAVEPDQPVQNKFSAAEVGWRMIIELTAGVFIGFGLGYGLDFLFNTKPVFILILTLFGLNTFQYKLHHFQRLLCPRLWPS